MPSFKDKARTFWSQHGRNGDRNPSPVPIDGASDSETLSLMLLEMYWDGVSREVKHIFLSLVELRNVEFCETEKAQNENGEVVGYETFIEQICEQPHPADYVNEMREDFQQGGPHQPVHPLRTRAPVHSKRFQEAVASKLREDAQDKEDLLHFRARSMLQAAGLLDIDKLVEYRPPDERLHVVKKGKAPQLKVDYFEKNGIPSLNPARCKSCRDILRGVLFKCKHEPCPLDSSLRTGDYFCEDCFRSCKHRKDHLVKRYKHCILDEVITQEISEKLCGCTTVPRIDRNGNPLSLYPIDPWLKHRQAADGYSKCRLFSLPGVVGEEKYRFLMESMESRKAKKTGQISVVRSSKRPVNEAVHALESRLNEKLDSDVPWVLRTVAHKFPFGNTHVSLMVGPLIIENGHTKTKYQGALITKRDPLNYIVKAAADVDDQHLRDSILVGYGDEKNFRADNRRIFKQYRVHRKERRLKACMKQIVGGAFSGYLDQKLEQEIVNDLISSSKFSPKSEQYTLQQIQKGTAAITDKLYDLLGDRIFAILTIISKRLFNKSVALEFDFFDNNCQMFTDSILPYEDFGGLFGSNRSDSEKPPYLLSFVVRIESYHKASVLTAYDVPNGLTEEYLLSFRAGRHDDSDIVDTLQEYWSDWGAFGTPLYKHQDHFGWDCTEAYKKDAPTCNNCTLSRHVWANPFDAWSIIQLALQKDGHWYPPTDNNPVLTKKQWYENRFKLFVAQDALIRGALAMSRTRELRQASDWFRTSNEPRYDRLKLGGIHRAQPYSHHFEPGNFSQSYIAPWAHFTYEHRVKLYEEMRLARQRATEVPPEKKEVEEIEFGGGIWVEFMRDLSVPIAVAAVSLDAIHLTNTAVLTAAVPDPEAVAAAAAAAADLVASIEALGDGIAQLGNMLGGLNG